MMPRSSLFLKNQGNPLWCVLQHRGSWTDSTQCLFSHPGGFLASFTACVFGYGLQGCFVSLDKRLSDGYLCLISFAASLEMLDLKFGLFDAVAHHGHLLDRSGLLVPAPCFYSESNSAFISFPAITSAMTYTTSTARSVSRSGEMMPSTRGPRSRQSLASCSICGSNAPGM